MGLYVVVDFHGIENLLNDILPDQKKFSAVKVLEISWQRHIPLFTDWVSQSVKGENNNHVHNILRL